MGDLNSGFWLGLAAAIPLSIVANLLTPKIQQWLSERSEKKSAKRVAELRVEYERIENLTKNPIVLHTYLLQQILFIVFFTSFAIAISGIFFFIGSALADGLFASIGNGNRNRRGCRNFKNLHQLYS